MDELRLYDKALTSDEARQLYDSYASVKEELELANVKAELKRLVDAAKELQGNSDGSTAYVALADAIEKAETALRVLTLPPSNRRRMSWLSAMGGVYALGITVTVNTDKVERPIDGSIFGINHRYAFNGYGSI